MDYTGIWIPLITPFKDGQVDYPSYQKLIRHYTAQGATGLVPMGTTGESPTIDDDEYERILNATMEYNEAKLPVILGLGGNNTAKLVKKLRLAEQYQVNAILSVCPYYSRPSQDGIYRHFAEIAQNTGLDIIIYNIPYRTGRNIENDTLRRLAEIPNIAGLKDSCGDLSQTMDLILNRPAGFQILCGEDVMFYASALLGGDGGILATAHVQFAKYVKMFRLIQENDHQGALDIWRELIAFIPYIFAEPNPAPLKYLLQRDGLIETDEIRLPMTTISADLERKLDQVVQHV